MRAQPVIFIIKIICRGLPSDDGDDLLTGDISALHLSDYDVYAQTGGRQRNSNNGLGGKAIRIFFKRVPRTH